MSEDRLEEISERIHKAYCKHYQQVKGESYWTGGDYSKLNEETKEYDRVIARLFISELERCRARIEQLETDLEEMHQSRKEIIAGGRSVLESWARERRHRKRVLKELKKRRAENEMFQGDVVRLQQTNRRLNRRCTDMEGALKEKLEKGKVEYRSFGRMLANAAAGMYKDEAENAKDASSAKGACMKAALNQLKIRTQELKECKAEVDTLSIAIAGVGGAFEKQRRHRKWALKEMKEKRGEVSEQMNEVKRLKAMLAIGHFVIRE